MSKSIYTTNRKPPRVRLQGATPSCVPFTLSAQIEAATGRIISPRFLWQHALSRGYASIGSGVHNGNQSIIANYFDKNVYLVEFAKVGKPLGRVIDGKLKILVPENKSRVAWFKDALRQGVLAFNKSGHSIYVYDLVSTPNPVPVKWIKPWKQEFFGYDPEQGLVQPSVASMRHQTVCFVYAPIPEN